MPKQKVWNSEFGIRKKQTHNKIYWQSLKGQNASKSKRILRLARGNEQKECALILKDDNIWTSGISHSVCLWCPEISRNRDQLFSSPAFLLKNLTCPWSCKLYLHRLICTWAGSSGYANSFIKYSRSIFIYSPSQQKKESFGSGHLQSFWIHLINVKNVRLTWIRLQHISILFDFFLPGV